MCTKEDEDTKLKFKPYAERSCTDILMTLLFIAGWVAAFVILGEAVRQGGSPYRVLYGVQHDGEICGYSSSVKDLKYAEWPISPNVDGFKYGIKRCTAACPPTTWKFYRYCIPVDASLNGFEVSTEAASRSIADLYTTWPVIFVSCFVAALLAYGYIRVLRVEKCRILIVWGSIFLVLAGGICLGYGLIKYAEKARSDPVTIDERALPAQILGWFIVGITVVIMLVVFYLRNRIRLALEVTGTAAMALTQMPLLSLFPVLPFLCIVAYAVYWIIVALYLFSVKSYTIENAPPAYAGEGITTYREYTWVSQFQKLFAYHFFHLLWVLQSFVYFTLMVVAGAMGNWYFSAPDPADPRRRQEGEEQGKLSPRPVRDSLLRTLRFHLGSAFFGALLIAIVQFIRFVVTYIRAKTTGSENRCAKACLCITDCCLGCIQTCIDIISRNGLIWTSIRGDSFCVASARAFSLIMSNLLRAAAMNFVGTFVVVLGQVAIALICAGVSAMIIESSYDGEINSSIVPIVVIFVLTYVIARIFLGIFSTSLDVMFLCVISDTEKLFVPQALEESFAKAEAEAKAAGMTEMVRTDAASEPTTTASKLD